MVVRLVEGHPEEVVADGLGGSLKKAIDFDPLILVACLLFTEKGLYGFPVLVAIDLVAQHFRIFTHCGDEVNGPLLFCGIGQRHALVLRQSH